MATDSKIQLGAYGLKGISINSISLCPTDNLIHISIQKGTTVNQITLSNYDAIKLGFINPDALEPYTKF